MARKWTVMVYLGADNNLSVDFLWNLKEMQEVDNVGPRPWSEVTVVAQYDPGQGIPTQRYTINSKTPKGPQNYRNDGKDGWLILDNDVIPKLAADDELRRIVDEELKKIVDGCKQLEDWLKEYNECPKELSLDVLASIDQLTGIVTGCKEGWLKKNKGRKKLSDDELKKIDFYLKVGKEREDRFKEYRNTLEGEKDPLNKNTGDPMTLLQFIFWGINTYEAEHYMVVLTGHGSGAVQDFLLKDENARDSLTLHELRDVFQLVQVEKLGSDRKLEIVGMDSCLMSMAEVYYQLAGSVDYLVGAEGFEPSGGWPYQRILRSLAEHSGDDPKDIAKRIVDDYVLYYFDYVLAGLSVDLSACQIVQPDTLADAIGDLGSNLKTQLEDRLSRELVISARQRAQSYKFDQYVDLVDFCDQLNDQLNNAPRKDGELNKCCGRVRVEIERIVKSSSYVGPDYQKSNGLSVYFPWAPIPEEFSRGYEYLQFTQETNRKWLEFVETFTETMRALASEETTLPEGKALYSAKTLYSPRTLYGGRGGQGPGGSLEMAYSKVPSLVWKPEGSIERHSRNVWWHETTNRISPAPGLSFYEQLYEQLESPEAIQKFEELIRQVRDGLTRKSYEQLDSPQAKNEFKQMMLSKGDIQTQIEQVHSLSSIRIDAQTLTKCVALKKLEDLIGKVRDGLPDKFYEQLDSQEVKLELRNILSKGDIQTQIEQVQKLTGIRIDAQTLTDSLVAARGDLTEYLGVDLVKPKSSPI